MKPSFLVVGIDPGGTTGICALPYDNGHLALDRVAVIQCNPAAVVPIVTALLNGKGIREDYAPILAVEEFVVNLRAARSGTAGAGSTARDLIGALYNLAADVDTLWYKRPAGIVKPWGTDKRIEAAGLEIAPKMRDARDAARHALYAAVHDGGIPDPLLKAGRA